MTKRVSSFELSLPVRHKAKPAYRWLYESLRQQILKGHIGAGTRLPASRDLARQYQLSRGTVVEAFDCLKSEGYIDGAVGSGTYVAKILPHEFMEMKSSATLSSPESATKRRWSAYARRVTKFPGFAARHTRAFRVNVPALDLFPTAIWARIMAQRMRRASINLLLGCDIEGYRPLREEVSAYLTTSRGVNCIPDQVIIVSSAQEALDLAARLLLDPGDRVCMEEPGYPGARIIFQAHGAKLEYCAVDDEGMSIPGPRKARLAYVTPAHQFPLGVNMSLARRLAILEWARKQHALILEDDYDSEFRYSARPIPAMQGLDRYGVVLFTGTFSKVLFPSLRLAYLIVPKDMIDRFAAAKSAITRHAPLLDQAVLCDFMAEGHFARHLRRMREVYAERISVLLQAAQEELAGILEVSPIEAGLQTVAWLRKGFDAAQYAASAAKCGVELMPIAPYYATGNAPHGLQLGFAAIPPRDIRRAVKLLCDAWKKR